MTAPRLLAVCAVTLMVTAFGHADPADATLSYEPIPGVLGPPAGTYAEAQVLVPASFAPGSVAQYRFAGHDSWISFDRPLYLDAFVGEERMYTLEFKSSDGSSEAAVSYLIDLRAPEPPVFKPAPGDIKGSLSLEVEGAGDLFISIDGAPFEPLPASGKIVFNAEADATRTVSASAFAVDPAGNASRFSTSRWRVYPSEMSPSYPFASEPSRNAIAQIEKSADIQAELVDLVGSARLTIKVPEGTVPCVAVNTSDPRMSTASYVDLSGTSTGTCMIPFPWGDDTEIVVHYGYERAGVRYIVSEPLRLTPGFPVDEAAGAPSRPASPSIRIEEEHAIMDWPATPWAVFFSIGAGEFIAYRLPVILDLGPDPVTLRYYMFDRTGTRSTTAAIELPARQEPNTPVISGLETGKIYGAGVVAIPQGRARLQYEFVEGDTPAPPVTVHSPALNQEGLRFEGRPGEVVRYQLRLAGEPRAQPSAQAAAAVQERFFSFSVDRQPPQIPETMQGLRSFSSSDSMLSFKPQSGTILVSISEDGNGPYTRYDGPLSINGSDEGRKRYIIRAYAEDEFGNRSDEMPRMDVLIDRSSLYTDARGRPGASGSPDDPIQYLDDAIDAAQVAGKRFVYVRGSVALRRPVVISRPVQIVGGFDADWNDSAISASIAVTVPPSSSSWAFVVDGGSLSLSSLEVSMNAQGAGGLIFSRKGPVVVSRSNLSLSGGIDMTTLRSNGGAITVESSSIKLTDCFTARGIEANGAYVQLVNSTIQCDELVKLFDAIRMSDSDASISGLRLEASPSQTLSAISAVRSTVTVESAVLFITGGASSCRIFSANASRLTISSVYIDAAWKGSAETFNALNGSTLRVAHLTALVNAPRAVFASSTGSNFEIYNSIASFSGNDSMFLRTDTMPGIGSVSANCLWGFSSYMDGVRAIRSLPDFNRLLSPMKPNFSEDPSRIFSGSVKRLSRLSKLSACFDGGSVIEWASGLDVLGKKRITPENSKPDIGAEEL